MLELFGYLAREFMGRRIQLISDYKSIFEHIINLPFVWWEWVYRADALCSPILCLEMLCP
jgi:hypothetical protein